MATVIVVAVVAFILYKLVQSYYTPGNKDNEAVATGCGIVLFIIVIIIAIATLS